MKTLLLFLSVTIRVPDFAKMNIAVFCFQNFSSLLNRGAGN